MGKLRNLFTAGLDALVTSVKLFAAENRAGISAIEAVEIDDELYLLCGALGLSMDQRHEAQRISLLFLQAGLRSNDVEDVLATLKRGIQEKLDEVSTNKGEK